MKTYIKIVVLFISLLLLSGCSHDFRNFNWGDSIQNVQSNSSDTFIKHDTIHNFLLYTGTIEEKSAYIYYNFNEKNQLYSGSYVLIAPIDSNHFHLINGPLILNYGMPTFDIISLRNSCYNKSSIWNTERSSIILTLVCNKSDINIYNTYISTKVFSKPHDHPDETFTSIP